MKEITRVHIAKTAYDIEVAAKRDLEKYIAALESYAEDRETLDDIEIRITELFAERGVVPGGVVAKDDVAAIRAQLGEPSDFAPEGDIAVGRDIDDQARKLYRDMDSAILGGVLAGIARFLRINPLWVRLLFVVLLIGSFGTASIVYLVLWLVVPSARTAAQKLQMRGQSVTLESIKQLGEQDEVENTTAVVIQRILRFGVGIFLLVGAIGALVATVWITFGLTFGTTDHSPLAAWRPSEAWWIALALGLFALAGVLLSALGFILADATFRKRWSRRIGIGVVTIITAGILSFIGGVGMVLYGNWQEVEAVRQSATTKHQQLTMDFAEVKKLTIELKGGAAVDAPAIVYTVSDGAPRAELSYLRNKGPTLDVARSDDMVTLSVGNDAENYYEQGPIVHIYGPALDELTIRGGSVKYTNGKKQSQLRLATSDYRSLYIEGTFGAVTAHASDDGSIDFSDAVIGTLDATTDGGTVRAGVVKHLIVTQPEACSSSAETSGQNIVEVQGVSSGTMTHNGKKTSANEDSRISTPCGITKIGGEEDQR